MLSKINATNTIGARGIDATVFKKKLPILDPLTVPFVTLALYALGPVIFAIPAAK